MRPGSPLLALALCAALAGACAASPPSPPPPPRVVHSATNPAATLAVAIGVNAMGLDMYAKQRSEPGNLVFSPASIGIAFGMLYGGAAGASHAEMARTMHFAESDLLAHDDAAVHEGFAGLLARADELEGGPSRLRIASRLWAQKDRGFSREFLALTRDFYGAEAENVDFGREAEAVRQRINAWVEKTTNDRIKDLLPPASVDASTVMVLANAVWFKGDWAEKFAPRETTDGRFTRLDGSPVQARMMHRFGPARFAHVDGVRLLELDYASSDLTMTLALGDGSLADLEAQLTPSHLSTWLAAVHDEKKLDVLIPRFEATRGLDLVKLMNDLGLGSLFSADADLSGLLESGQRGLHVSGAFHKAFVTVNEEGAEAAAATGMIIETSAALNPLEFHADRPFLWMIRDKRTGLILFLGRVVDPLAAS